MNFLVFFFLLLASAVALPVKPRELLRPIRILPLGDSITWGYGSTTGNAYRLQLFNDLTLQNTYSVNFVGDPAQAHGVMLDPDNAGYPGYTIDEIGTAALKARVYDSKPNVVLIHVGTNDLTRNPPKFPYAEAPERLATLVNQVAVGAPGATIFLAKIVPATRNAAFNANIQKFNSQVETVAQNARAAGANIVVVDMSVITDLPDGIHPSDLSYNQMGDIWYRAILAADQAGMISPIT